MADKSNGRASRRRNGDGDLRSCNRRRKHSSFLDFFNGDFEVEENASTDGEIKIKTATGKIIYLKVKSSDTIGSIKLKIQTEEGILFDQQELIFNGLVLEDIKTLASLLINDSTLNLVCKSSVFINISIKNLKGRKIYSFDVKPTDTIASVKEHIKIKKGISVDDQVLIFNKMVLGDADTLFDFHINSKSTLTLIRKSRGFMKIFIKTLTGETITEEVKPSYTIESIKAKIQHKVHISCDEQALVFNEMVLHDINTLADYNIKKESTLTLMRILSGFMRIFIKTLTGRTITLYAKPSDTVNSIKAKIKDYVRIHNVNFPCDDHELISDETFLHNNDTLAEYNIKRESTLTLVPISTGVMQIFIKAGTGKTFILEVKPSDTIHNVKTKISDQHGYSPYHFRLVFNNQILEDRPTLVDYNIKREATLTLVTISRGVMQIFFKIHNGKTITLDVKPSDTVHNVKVKISVKQGCLPSDQRLVFNRQLLEDARTLADYQIHKESTVDLFIRPETE